jgi:hypothetical protein
VKKQFLKEKSTPSQSKKRFDRNVNSESTEKTSKIEITVLENTIPNTFSGQKIEIVDASPKLSVTDGIQKVPIEVTSNKTQHIEKRVQNPSLSVSDPILYAVAQERLKIPVLRCEGNLNPDSLPKEKPSSRDEESDKKRKLNKSKRNQKRNGRSIDEGLKQFEVYRENKCNYDNRNIDVEIFFPAASSWLTRAIRPGLFRVHRQIAIFMIPFASLAPNQLNFDYLQRLLGKTEIVVEYLKDRPLEISDLHFMVEVLLIHHSQKKMQSRSDINFAAQNILISQKESMDYLSKPKPVFWWNRLLNYCDMFGHITFVCVWISLLWSSFCKIAADYRATLLRPGILQPDLNRKTPTIEGRSLNNAKEFRLLSIIPFCPYYSAFLEEIIKEYIPYSAYIIGLIDSAMHQDWFQYRWHVASMAHPYITRLIQHLALNAILPAQLVTQSSRERWRIGTGILMIVLYLCTNTITMVASSFVAATLNLPLISVIWWIAALSLAWHLYCLNLTKALKVLITMLLLFILKVFVMYLQVIKLTLFLHTAWLTALCTDPQILLLTCMLLWYTDYSVCFLLFLIKYFYPLCPLFFPKYFWIMSTILLLGLRIYARHRKRKF